MEIREIIIDKIKSAFPDALLDVYEFRNDFTLTISPEKILEVGKLLKEDSELEFILCKDVTAIDWAKRKNRFTLVYFIYSFKNNFNLRLKCNIESDSISSVASLWESANWYERETFDMYGIKFKDHPDMRRMYMPEDFEYYPLRKDFPLMGIPGSLPLPRK